MKKFSKTFESIDDGKLEEHIEEFSQDFKDEGYSFKVENESHHSPKFNYIKFYITIQKYNGEEDRLDTILYQEMLEQFLDRLFDIYPSIDYIISTEMKFDRYRVKLINGNSNKQIQNYINTDIRLMNKEINLRNR